MDDQYWSSVRAMRLRIADLLDSLDPVEWDEPSLCEHWRVRDVAGHLALITTITTWDMLRAAPRAGCNPHRINAMLAVRNGSRAPGELVAEIRAHAGDRRTARVLNIKDSLFDVIVHGQDIARPLGRDLSAPAEDCRRGLQRVWSMGWPFHAPRVLSGLTLTATDTAWTAGAGPVVAGPALELLLVATGRIATAIDNLHGPGVDRLHAIVR
jgi:uncharacterized protein (TIGR03083 family)